MIPRRHGYYHQSPWTFLCQLLNGWSTCPEKSSCIYLGSRKSFSLNKYSLNALVMALAFVTTADNFAQQHRSILLQTMLYKLSYIQLQLHQQTPGVTLSHLSDSNSLQGDPRCSRATCSILVTLPEAVPMSVSHKMRHRMAGHLQQHTH